MNKILAQLPPEEKKLNNQQIRMGKTFQRMSIYCRTVFALGLIFSLFFHFTSLGSANSPRRTFEDIQDAGLIIPQSDRFEKLSFQSTFVASDTEDEFLQSAQVTSRSTSNYPGSLESEYPDQIANLSDPPADNSSLDPVPQSISAIPSVAVTLVRMTYTSAFLPPSPDPSGLAYIPESDKLIISDGEVNEILPPNPAAFTGYNLYITTRVGTLDSLLTTITDPGPPIFFSDEPTGVAYNPANKYLYFTDDNSPSIGIYQLDPVDGIYNNGNDVVSFFSNLVGSDPEGIAFDDSRGKGHLMVVDGVNQELYDINLGGNGVLNSNDSVNQFDIGPATPSSPDGIFDPEGVEFNPASGHLYIADRNKNRIVETTLDGTIIRYLDLSADYRIVPINPSGLALAPASDGSAGNNLYIIDRGVDNNTDPNENDGRMYEVSIPNSPPIVDAGPNQVINLPNNASLDGTVTDDGQIAPLTYLWEKSSGPGTVTFGDSSAVDTTASFSVEGTYVLRLYAHDGEFQADDTVSITVNPFANQAPVVDAGSDQSITLPQSAILNGFVSDDGLPNPPGAVTTSWSKVNGPGPVNFTDPSVLNTSAIFSKEGIYTLRLTAVDGAEQSSDELFITVNPVEINITRIWLPFTIVMTTRR